MPSINPFDDDQEDEKQAENMNSFAVSIEETPETPSLALASKIRKNLTSSTFSEQISTSSLNFTSSPTSPRDPRNSKTESHEFDKTFVKNLLITCKKYHENPKTSYSIEIQLSKNKSYTANLLLLEAAGIEVEKYDKHLDFYQDIGLEDGTPGEHMLKWIYGPVF